MVQDPTNKYMYVSAHNSGQVTGKKFDANTGALSQLARGSTFSATGLAYLPGHQRCGRLGAFRVFRRSPLFESPGFGRNSHGAIQRAGATEAHDV